MVSGHGVAHTWGTSSAATDTMTTRIVTVAAILAAALVESSGQQQMYRNWYPFYGHDVGQQQVIYRKVIEPRGINDSPLEPVPYSPRIATTPFSNQYRLTSTSPYQWYTPSIYRKCQGANCDRSNSNIEQTTKIPGWFENVVVEIEDVQQKVDAILKKLSKMEACNSDSIEGLSSITSPVAVAIKEQQEVDLMENERESSENEGLQRREDNNGDVEELETCDEDTDEESKSDDRNGKSKSDKRKTIAFSFPSGRKLGNILQKSTSSRGKTKVDQEKIAKPTFQSTLGTWKVNGRSRLETTTEKYTSQSQDSGSSEEVDLAQVVKEIERDESTTLKNDKQAIFAEEFGIDAENLPKIT